MEIALLFTALSLGITSLISVQSTVLGVYLIRNASALPLGALFGLVLVAVGLRTLYHLVKTSFLSRGQSLLG